MAERVKPRRHESPRRRAQAAATRRAILDAARALFDRDGYASTTMAAIASEAGVALKTVCVAFETKSGVLRALWHLLLRGDQEDAPVGDRAWYREVLEEADPERRLQLNARNSRAVKERAVALMRVIRDAASIDAEIGALWARIQHDFSDNELAIVRTPRDDGRLRPGLDARRAAHVLWTLNHPDVWLLLVGERGWTPDRYEQWLVDTTREQLLG